MGELEHRRRCLLGDAAQARRWRSRWNARFQSGCLKALTVCVLKQVMCIQCMQISAVHSERGATLPFMWMPLLENAALRFKPRGEIPSSQGWQAGPGPSAAGGGAVLNTQNCHAASSAACAFCDTCSLVPKDRRGASSVAAASASRTWQESAGAGVRQGS